jgi:hypothetical protein
MPQPRSVLTWRANPPRAWSILLDARLPCRERFTTLCEATLAESWYAVCRGAPRILVSRWVVAEARGYRGLWPKPESAAALHPILQPAVSASW